MGKALELDESNFDSTIAQGVSMVDFWAPWCGPCRMVAPIVEELAGEYAGKVNVCKVNTDENQDIAVKYGIRSIPSILFFKNGEQVDTIVGAVSKQNFEQKLKNIIG
ncbi:MAG: thioredoxin 1 [Campylobacterota bacterium]|nr:thioredoxin 1 [Campylobacterota bacterium]